MTTRLDDSTMPDFFTTAPNEALVRAQQNAPVPAGLVGRAGVLLVKTPAGETQTYYAWEPLSGPEAGFVPSWEDLRAETLWAERAAAAVPHVPLIDANGQRFTLNDFLAALFADYPDKPLTQGGTTIERRKGLWREAMVRALSSPAVQLLLGYNERRAAACASGAPLAQPIGLAEWWVGPSPQHAIRHDGTFYPPRSSAKFLLETLTRGLALCPISPLTAPDEAPEVPILYEDEAIVVINKPTRLASVPGIREKTSAKAILERAGRRLRVVHRLDMDTSGVMLFAKTPEAEKVLHETFREGIAMKRYVARLSGEYLGGDTRVLLPLALNQSDRPRQCVLPESQGGKPSETTVEVLRHEVMPSGQRKTVVALYPDTGRTHQLRVHCAHAAGLGQAIDGDPFYGPLGLRGESRATRLCLHAEELTLPHPETGEVMTFEAPADFPLF